MKHLLIPLLVLLPFLNVVNSSHLNNQRELIVTSESTRESIELAKYLKDNGVVKYSAYWCPNCLNQSELFGKQAYRYLKDFNMTKGMALLLLKPLNLPAKYVLNLIIYITNPRNNIGY